MSRPKQRLCVRGHDTWETGRYSNSSCKRCVAEYHPTLPKAGYLPAHRLRRITSRSEAISAWMGFRDCSEATATRAWDRLWSARWVSIDCADRWCIALDTHLAIVFPEAYREGRRVSA